jgi:peroxiredoxin
MKRLWVAILLTLAILTAKTQTQYTVYVFLSETCPICQYHTLTLKNLHKEYAAKGFAFVGIFPNPDSDSATIDSFGREYKIGFTLMKDTERKLMSRFGATITPQVFVVDANDSLFYKGRIDDKFVSLGKRKTTPLSTDLKNALDAILNKRPIAIKQTEAIGCFIDSDY